MTPQRQHREEWNDRALDQLEARVENLEHDRALDQLEARVENLERDVDSIGVRIGDQPTRRATWLGFVLTLATGVIVPITVAAIGAWAIVKAAGI